MTDYDIFAPFYDAVMGDRGPTVRLLRRLIKRHHPAAHTVLELGCGTGSILQGLSDHYQLAGLERSAGMLEVARTKLPDAELYQGDIAEFQLDRTYDVIFCVFDTINHLTSFNQWSSLFTASHRHLNPGGLLIFDMNTTGRLQAVAAAPELVERFDHDHTFHLDARLVARHTIEWSVLVEIPAPDHTIDVREEYVRETAFPIAHVQSELERQGFEILEAFATDKKPLSDLSDRIYYVCRAK